LTENEKKTYFKAIQRMDKYIVLTNNEFILKVNSGKEINMSENLFESCKGLKDYANKLIAKQILTVYSGKLYANKFSDSNLINVPRLKSGDENSGTTECTYSWSGCDLYLSNSTLQSIDNACQNSATGTTVGTGVLLVLGYFFPEVVTDVAPNAMAYLATMLSGASNETKKLAQSYPKGANVQVTWGPVAQVCYGSITNVSVRECIL
jgi:hypothetical protein